MAHDADGVRASALVRKGSMVDRRLGVAVLVAFGCLSVILASPKRRAPKLRWKKTAV